MEILPDIESVFWKSSRLKTYEQWPFGSSDVCNPECMAAAGFVAIGGKEEPDLVECFICHKQMDGWNFDDDPWEEHTKHQPSCPLVLLKKRDEKDWTVADLFHLIKVYKANQLMRTVEETKARAKEESIKFAKSIPNIYKDLKKAHKE